MVFQVGEYVGALQVWGPNGASQTNVLPEPTKQPTVIDLGVTHVDKHLLIQLYKMTGNQPEGVNAQSYM